MTFVPRFSDFEKIVFFTGAGLSAESGIPTYRGKGGTWKSYNYEEVACQAAFDKAPHKVWDFHDERRGHVAGCNPNRAHEIIAQVQREKPNTTIITQNIDGLHQRAGATQVTELHGSLWRVRCTCGVERLDLTTPISNRACECGQILRPDIVWFGDWLEVENLIAAKQAIDNCDLLVTVGTSGSVYPAADFPCRAPESAMTVEVNLANTSMSDFYKHHMRGTASDMLAQMM